MPPPVTLSSADFKAALRPPIWRGWIARSRIFLIAAAAGLVMSAWVFPPATAPLFKKAYAATKKGEGVIGSIKTFFGTSEPKGKPLWARKQETWQSSLYWLFAMLALAGLWRHLGAAAEEARNRAQKLENEGTRLVTESALREAARRLEDAARWTADGGHRRTLHETVNQLRSRIAAQTAGMTPVPAQDHTVALGTTAGGTVVMERGQSADAVGPQGRYKLRRLLGKGGMGEVYEALDGMLDRVVAMKKLPPHLAADAQFLQRFTHEAKALARLSHPAIVQIYDIINDSQGVFIALEFLSGGDLHGRIASEGRLSAATAIQLAQSIAEGLAFAHESGIVHRDIKPLNVMLTPDGKPKITDFGLAKMGDATQLTVDGSVLGSPLYMSPEQAQGKPADARSDVYSFGIMLYAMLCGEPPYRGDTQQVLMQHLTQRVGKVPGVSKGLNEVVQRCTEPSPGDRYQTAGELLTALRKLETE